MIELKHIEFAYESGSELLRDINMQVNDGEYLPLSAKTAAAKVRWSSCSWACWSRQKVN